MKRRRRTYPPRRQDGASAIEFALTFPLFFFLFYGLVCWGFVFMAQHGITLAAQEGARAALAVSFDAFHGADGFDRAGYESAVKQRARQAAAAALDTLPAPWRRPVLEDLASERAVTVACRDPVAGKSDCSVRVTLRYPDFRDNPVLPGLSLPGLALLLPRDLVGSAEMAL